MKTAMRKGASRAIATLLSVVMAVGLLPAGAMASAASGGQSDDFARIVHLDMGRKYFSPESIKSLIDTMAASGYDQLELDFSNNEEGQFRFALSDMTVTYTYYTEEPTAIIQDELTPELPVNDVPAEEPPTAGPETPAASQEPAPEETPAESEEPAPEETPAEGQEPAPEETPAESQEPVPEETPAEGQEPAPEETPAGSEEPAPEESAPAAAEETDEIGSLLDTALSGVATQTLGSGEAGALIIEYERVPHEVTVDLTPALGEAITEDEMHEIITYANSKGIEIVPLLNSPGHMGAILSTVTADVEGEPKDYSYNGSNSLDITSEEARAFGMAVVEKYAAWFAKEGCTTFNIGADEFANDIYNGGGMGFGHLVDAGEYGYFVSYVNELYDMLTSYHYETVRAFNDGFYYGGETDADLNPDIEICYWSSGWFGYEVASAETIAQMGHRMINTNGDYYYILGKNSVMTENGPAYAANFDPDMFQGASRSISADGAMFCIWCDYPNATEDDARVITDVQPYLENFASTLPTVPVTDEATGVSVEAAGVAEVTVQPATVSAIGGEGGQTTYVAYDITPMTQDGAPYTGQAQVTIPLGALASYDGSELTAFVVESDGSISPISDGVKTGDSFTFTAPHFSVMGVLASSRAAGDSYEQKTGSMEAGEYLIVYEGSRNIGEWWNPQQETYHVALSKNGDAVEVTLNDDGTISIPDGYSADDLLWDIQPSGSGWTVQDADGEYLDLSATYRSFPWGQWNYSADFDSGTANAITISGNDTYSFSRHITSGYRNTTSYLNGDEDSFSASDDADTFSLYWSAIEKYDVTIIGEMEDGTQVYYGTEEYPEGWQNIYAPTVNGYELVEGETNPKEVYVTTDNAATVTFKYQESQTPPYNALTDNTLTIEWWITNSIVRESMNDWAASSVTVNASRASVEEGVVVEGDLSPETAYSNFDGWVELTYWQTVRLDAQHHQTSASSGGSGDQTAYGTPLTRVRYHNGAWQYMDANGAWQWVLEDDQLVSYYMRPTDLTDEVTTLVKDWGYLMSDSQYENGTPSTNQGQVALSVAVVYPSGDMNPTEEDIYSTTTQIFNYEKDWSGTDMGRDIGIIAVENNSQYRVSRITVTDGERDERSWGYWNDNVWYPDDSITWEKVYNVELQRNWYDETEVWNAETDGGAPMVNGKTDGIYWTAKSTAKLVLIYLEPVATPDSLYVNYHVDGESDPFWTDLIQVENMPGETPHTFFNSLQPGGPYETGEIDLPDEAYVTNSSGANIRIYKDLTQHMGISTTPYGNGQYKYVRAVLSEDGKTLDLYFSFDGQTDLSYVLDYGLPVTVPLSDLGIDNTQGIDRVTVQAAGGTATVSSDNASFTYTPTSMIDGVRIATVRIRYQNESSQTHTVSFIPASIVYYEAEQDGFIQYTDSANATWVGDGRTAFDNQTAERLGGKVNTYGSDPAYNGANGSTDSGGKSVSVTVTANGTDGYPTASFDFTGRAVDIIARTDNTSGLILVDIEGGGRHRTYVVNNYFTEELEENGLYQIPVLRVSADEDLTYGDYHVEIKVVPFATNDPSDGVVLNMGNATTTTFYLDAVRVYAPLGADDAIYAQDGEDSARFYEVGDLWLQNLDSNETVWIDGNAEAGQSDYEDPGPNNEVYLASRQSVTLNVNGIYDSNKQDLYLAARNMEGGGIVTLQVNSGTIEVNGGSDQYYGISGYVGADGVLVIENGSATRIALTTIKVTDKATPAGGN